MTTPDIRPDRLLSRLTSLGQIGRENERLCRLALSPEDAAGRQQLKIWMEEVGLQIETDKFGNIFGIWAVEDTDWTTDAVMLGSHIDTVIDAGIYDGCFGVLGALEVVQALKEAGFSPARPLIVAAFTNEEGVRFQPNMMGSLVHAGGLSADEAMDVIGIDGKRFGDALEELGLAGDMEIGTIRPRAFVELHVEQGPVLDHEGLALGVVDTLQGISWQQIVFDGDANHAGTTPMQLRRDAGQGVAATMRFIDTYVRSSNAPTVATVGRVTFEPNVVNVIPSRATMTMDIRDSDAERLRAAEAALQEFLVELGEQTGLSIRCEPLARFEPVVFDAGIAAEIEASARRRDLAWKRMTSGAGHDAQMIARIAPTAMIFVPSIGGISHSPEEATAQAHLADGARVLMDVAMALSGN